MGQTDHLCIAAERDGEGTVYCTYLRCANAALTRSLVVEIERPSGTTRVPVRRGAIIGIIKRYGKPLEEGVSCPADAPALPCHESSPDEEAIGILRPLRFRPYGWALPLDYLVMEPAQDGPLGDTESLCLPTPLFCSALLHLCA